MAITLRVASDDDAAFLLKVYASTRDDEMSMVPWSDEQKETFLRFQFEGQHNFYHEQFPDASYDIILEDDEPIGRLYVRREAAEIGIMDITVLPERRNRGMGTSLVRTLLNEGAETNKRVCIWVESYNPSIRLFERLGFSKAQEDGVNWLMERRPEN